MQLGRLITGICLALMVLPDLPIAAETRGLSVKLRGSDAVDAEIIEEVELYSKSYALVIGNDNYEEGWARLGQARNDARKIAKALEERGFSVTLKTDLKSHEMEQVFKDFFLDKGEEADSRLFVWYAGHGHTQGGESYLVPIDARSPSKRKRFLSKALSLRRFSEFVRLAESKHVFTIVDSCFAGTIFDVARASSTPPQITRITTQPVRQFLTSGDAGQTVADNGTFADLLIEALDGQRRADTNNDGYLTASELGSYLDAKMSNLTNNRQTPRYGKLQDKRFDKGDFVFSLLQPEEPEPKSQQVAAAGVATNSRAIANAAKIQQETLFWESIKDSGDAKAYNAYLVSFPTGTFAPLARLKLQEAETKDNTRQRGLDLQRRKLEEERKRLEEYEKERRQAEEEARRKAFAAERAKLIAERERYAKEAEARIKAEEQARLKALNDANARLAAEREKLAEQQAKLEASRQQQIASLAASAKAGGKEAVLPKADLYGVWAGRKIELNAEATDAKSVISYSKDGRTFEVVWAPWHHPDALTCTGTVSGQGTLEANDRCITGTVAAYELRGEFANQYYGADPPAFWRSHFKDRSIAETLCRKHNIHC